MTDRTQRKARAQAERQERERQTALAEQRRRRVRQLGAVLAVAAVAVVVLVLVSQGGKDEPNASGGSAIAGVADTRDLLAGIPQRGTRLGDPEAPLVLTEFVDLQCPFCARFATDVLPGVIERYVRPGKLRLELRTLTFLGEDSVRGARAAHAAAARNRLWNVVELWFRNQGQENSGYADDDFITRIARAGEVSPAVAVAAAGSAAQDKTLRAAQVQATAAGVQSTPAFLIGSQAAAGDRLEYDGDVDAFNAAIAKRLNG